MTAPAPVFANAGEAMAMVHAGLGFLAAANATTMTGPERARCLRELEQADAVATAARTSVLGVFAAGQDYADDGDYSAFSWLLHRTQVTRGTAGDHTAWVKRGKRIRWCSPRSPPGRSRSPTRGRSAGGRTGCPRSPARPPTRSCSARPPPGSSWRTWPGWPPRCTIGPGRTSPTPTRVTQTPARKATARIPVERSMIGS